MATSAKSPVRQKNKDCSSESSNVQIGIVQKKKKKKLYSVLAAMSLSHIHESSAPTDTKAIRLCKLIEFSLNLHDFFSKTGRQGCYCNTSQIRGTVSIQFNSKKTFSFSHMELHPLQITGCTADITYGEDKKRATKD